MLRLKRVGGADQITLSMAVRQPLFNRDFCIALAWALGIHIAALLLFTINILSYSGSKSLFPPVTVIATPEYPMSGSITAEADPESYLNHTVSKPPTTKFTPPSLIPDLLFHDPNIFKMNVSIPDWPTPSTSPPSFKISATGHLAGLNFVTPPLPHLNIFGDFVTSFQVRVQGKTGKVFWYKLQKSSGQPLIDKTSEKMLRILTFENFSEDEIHGGILEFAYHLEDSND